MKFLKKVVVDENNCWLFQGATRKTGLPYGWVTYKNKQMNAHRASWIVANGEIKDGFCVCHKCDVPACINPDHLFLGTHTDNMQDMWQKNRQVLVNKYGEDHPNSKLTLKQVIEIKKMLSENIKQKIIAQKFNVTRITISNIKTKKRWAKYD
jgi:hypothetical protein